MSGFCPGTPLWPAGHLPRKGGDWQPQRRRSFGNVYYWRKHDSQMISPLAGEMAGRPEGGVKELGAEGDRHA
ncbi:hypothetical protein FJ937_15055 [Mesorhizobium sp. B2-4-4]|nr:hypothetical protein FJ426_01585 [Mesorhizobium sp. B2-6-4]TPK00155.1 hypothetical protein FJ489_05440 [Mesorhizobium sp. B2-5-12]TPK27882.1 hypothetical protein FJ562_05575 [Mesorhizobium sp. B2-5-6]TPL50569.1 hypothetical protein FJ937_15055 [Mesorhizobium sp. B2-4-4]TPN00146.1 hypothetical protein FJ966_07510 [Mesorhizobium sp. B2-1-5]TPN40561.1 hypothetical protein FJ979_08070 [Mesorhizobium sp. B1-1-6]